MYLHIYMHVSDGIICLHKHKINPPFMYLCIFRIHNTLCTYFLHINQLPIQVQLQKMNMAPLPVYEAKLPF